MVVAELSNYSVKELKVIIAIIITITIMVTITIRINKVAINTITIKNNHLREILAGFIVGKYSFRVMLQVLHIIQVF